MHGRSNHWHLKSNDNISAALKDNDNIIPSPKNPHLIATCMMQNQLGTYILTTCMYLYSQAIHPTCFYWAFTADSCIVPHCRAVEASMSFLIVLSM